MLVGGVKSFGGMGIASVGVRRFYQCVLEAFQNLYSFFVRYLGSKISSGYQFTFDKILTPAEAAPYLPYVSAAAYGFNGKVEEFLLPLGWRPITPAELGFQDAALIATPYAYFDKATGLKISFAERGEEVVIAMPGLISSAGNEKDEKAREYGNSFRRDPAKAINLLGGVPFVYKQAEFAIRSLIALERFKGKKIVLIGQCFGGSIASYVALKTGMKAICFNSLQLGAGLQAEIGEERLKRAKGQITHLCVQGDWLTDSRAVEWIDRILSFLRIRTPGNFGTKYQIPSAYASCFLSHGFVLGSLMHYLGHDKRATPRDITIAGC